MLILMILCFFRDQLDHKELQDNQESRDQLVTPVELAEMEKEENPELRDQLAIPAHQEHLASP